MEVKIKIDLPNHTYEWLQKLAKALNMKGIEELLLQELQGGIDNLELWLDRYHILQTYHAEQAEKRQEATQIKNGEPPTVKENFPEPTGQARDQVAKHLNVSV